jgi:SAM-dependent methyltransferase
VTGPVLLRADDGRLLPLDPARWHGPPTATEKSLLAGLRGPVLDVGCGPGRIVEGLAQRGVAALGVDPARGAVAMARARGCPVLQRSVFAPLPGEGRWATLLLLDGNIGIGGDPIALLNRSRRLIRSDGLVLVEVEPPGWAWVRCRARLERRDEFGPWFDWSVVGADAIVDMARRSGLMVASLRRARDDRWFAYLHVEPRAASVCA